MPAQRKTNQSRGLTAAGLIAVTAATLLMMAWAIFPTAAFADGTVQWEKNQGLPAGQSCPNGAHWILSPSGDITAATLHVLGQNITMNQNGPNGSFEADSGGPITTSTSASADFSSPNPDEDPHLVLSHCLGGVTPNIGITKSATSTQVSEGGAVSYTITVENTGDGDATGVVVTDNLDDAFTAVSATFDGPGANDVNCPVSLVNQITCTIGTLGPNQSATVTINATAPQLPLTEGGPCTLQIPNQATVDSEQTAPKTSNGITVTVTGTGCEEKTPNIGITKSATSTQVSEGGAVSYTITVENTGDGDATGVVVTDNLDDAFTAVSATFDGPGANDVNCPVSLVNQITCTIGTLGPNQSATVTINATAPQLPLTEGGPCTLQIPNQATVDSEQTAPKTSNGITVTVTGTGCTPGGGGGGGGGGTTTTPPPAPTTTPIVAPTTVHNTTTATDEVLPTTVRPGKLAFTGIEDVVPIGALALTLMTTGSGLLWAGSRRRRHDGSEDED